MSLCIISMIFQHFAHSILLMMFLHFVPQFITVDLYFFNTASLLTLEFHIFAMSTCNQGQFLPIKISGDMHVTTSCCLTVCISNQIAYILQMARSNALTCIYDQELSCSIATLLLKDPCRGKLCLQVTKM